MKRFILIPFFFTATLCIKAQRYSDIGLLLGSSYYMGQINPTRHFYNPSLAFGGLLRYNFNKRYALRISGFYTNLKGSDDDFDRINPDRPNRSFSAPVMDLAAQVEFNFFPYITGEKKWMYSPYLTGGLGFASISGMPQFMIPFGLGFKINITDRLSSGLEWSFRKTFTDKIDTVESPLGNTLINNNDWYSFFGIFITYKFVKFAADCPAYN
ncbi:MAG: hypothetical protein JW894_14290 [Bacteroidales bacterium]|nr:hypothetical protein [Bacteroidales bacterium]